MPLQAWAAQRRDTSILQADSEDKLTAVALSRFERRPWRINEALLRACLDTVLAGVSYLL